MLKKSRLDICGLATGPSGGGAFAWCAAAAARPSADGGVAAAAGLAAVAATAAAPCATVPRDADGALGGDTLVLRDRAGADAARPTGRSAEVGRLQSGAAHHAAEHGLSHVCAALLARTDFTEINAKTNDGKTALQCATSSGNSYDS